MTRPVVAPAIAPVIAIDGPAASGKGTLARRIAAHHGLAYLDSGSLYRAVAAQLLADGIDPSNETAAVTAARNLDLQRIDGFDLRSREVGAAASVVAAIPPVREALLRFQRNFAKAGAVMDGRDIGTVVVPDADVKLFVTASLDVRARRRAAELAAAGQAVDAAGIARDLEARDRRDTERAVAPLRQADDALLLDTSDLAIEAAFQAALALIEDRLGASLKRGS